MTRAINFPTKEGIDSIIKERDAELAERILQGLYEKIFMYEEDMTGAEFSRYAKKFNELMDVFIKAGLIKEVE